MAELLAVTPPAEISGPLLAWFRRHQRDLPWRRDTRPYAIWVSEMMLQQTQVSTVIPYYNRWMERFPTVEALAAAEEDDVLHAWQGLGYYSRARSLLRGAREVVRSYGGRVPDQVEALLALPGIGRYTAGAIASIAYNQPAPIVDGNVLRVLTRLFALRGDPRKAPLHPRLWELAEALIPEGEAREFNPALMELGATICTPLRPRCRECPVAEACVARNLGIPEELPETAPGPEITAVQMAAGLVRRGHEVLLAQRPATATRWANMWEFPNTEVQPGESPQQAAVRAVREVTGLAIACTRRATLVRHSVTRYRIALEAFHCHPADAEPNGSGSQRWAWVPVAQLGDYALPAAHRKIANHIAGQEDQGELAFHD